MLKIVIIILVLVSFCCHSPLAPKPEISLKDSAVKRHMALIDSFGYYDTLDRDYRILKAYVNDDSNFFVRMNEDMDITEKYRREFPERDTCVHLPKLSDLAVDEAYRFSHEQSFCDYGQRITITRSGELVQLHYLEYGAADGLVEYQDQDGKRVVGPGCKVVKEFTKKIPAKSWDKLERHLYEADYWGLKSYHYELSTDGSSWQIEAYTKRPKEPEGQQIHFVSRHCSCNDAFKALGTYFLKSSGEKTMCGGFF